MRFFGQTNALTILHVITLCQKKWKKSAMVRRWYYTRSL